MSDLKEADTGLDLIEIHASGGYSSEFEYDGERERKLAKRNDLATNKKSSHHEQSQADRPREQFSKEHSRTIGQAYQLRYSGLDAYTLHKKLVNDYLLYYSGAKAELFKKPAPKGKTDIDIIREQHRFLWTAEDETESSWDKALAKRYYDKLFKEYCICDLVRYKENKVAMRWRTEQEVIDGKGQFICGNRKCEEGDSLRTWEVNFGYKEHGEKKNALVKLRLCLSCSYKLNYRIQKREVTKKKRKSDHHGSSECKSKHVKHGPTKDSGKQSAEDADVTAAQGTSEHSDSVWSGPAPVIEEKSKDEEIDEYLEALFV
ncbi:PREDICTED: protein FRA10AC1 homolog [Priapulus caudatus]|uniref:Protein FRA10AC1 homolog n=1 Tax=Priapulus caudatus TaxID=37621 RepID=A0ABM1E4A8_PRICU|nr:PREDICTED: protein FRA10AC1 homolog [Priapulus caudatus]XP_014667030.1 PREDICTED: protein FRA10AC1 homolog [Priapulus caudatus]